MLSQHVFLICPFQHYAIMHYPILNITQQCAVYSSLAKLVLNLKLYILFTSLFWYSVTQFLASIVLSVSFFWTQPHHIIILTLDDSVMVVRHRHLLSPHKIPPQALIYYTLHD
jgi:hypothetical protein